MKFHLHCLANLAQAGPRLLLRWPWMHASTLSRWHLGTQKTTPAVSHSGAIAPPRDFGGEMAGHVGKQRVSACNTWDIHSQSIEHDWTFFARFCQFNMNSRTYYLPKHHRSYFFQQENPSGSAAELKWWWINWYPICRYLWCAKPTIITL